MSYDRPPRVNFSTSYLLPYGITIDFESKRGVWVPNDEKRATFVPVELGIEDAERIEIKGRFKELVKRHHPDANGGDRSSEDKLREIIEAYNYLKSAGYC